MDPTRNEGKSVVVEKFIKTLKWSIKSIKMAANDSKFYLGYFNYCSILSILIDEYVNTYHRCIVKKNLLMLIILACVEKLNQFIEFLNLKLLIQSELLSTPISLATVILKIGQGKNLLLIFC